jgi:hypothetical protein
MIIIDGFVRDNDLLRQIQQSEEFWKLGYHWYDGWWNNAATTLRQHLITYIWRDYCPMHSRISLSGFEHWVGVYDANKTVSNEGGDFSLISHFDKDEKLWEETGKIVNPILGTIFYPDPCNDEIEGGYLKVWKTHDTDFNAPYELIEPKYNRLVIFDASQLHAVTPVTKGTRKAIAINLWDSPLTDVDNMLR